MKDKKYYKTEKEFNLDDPKYLPEEKEIIRCLDYPKNTNEILEAVNKKLKINRTWYYIDKLINQLKEESQINERK